MSDKAPTAFDPDRYAAAYPDVGLSGLSPREHYRRFGRLLGRDPTGRTADAALADDTDKDAIEPLPATAAVSANWAAPQPAEVIIARPDNLQLQDVVPLQAAPKYGYEPITLAHLAAGPFSSDDELRRAGPPLVAYARLVSAEAPVDVSLDDDPLGAAMFRNGDSRIARAWYVGRQTLRLMIGDVDGGESALQGWSLRAYQAMPASTARLRSAGKGVLFPAFGPLFHDVELVHPLMPLILELSEAAGETKAIALLAFPSLLPGGVHAAELRALQNERNPMDAFWSLSEQLVREALGERGAPERAIGRLAWPEGGSDLAAEVTDWATALFKLSEHHDPSSERSLRLELVPHSVPTISALVSRSMRGAGVGPYLVAEPDTFRPRWSVVLPGNYASEAVPTLAGAEDALEESPTSTAVPIAIQLRKPVRPALSAADRTTTGLQICPLTVVVEATNAERSSELVETFRKAAAGAEILIRHADEFGAVSERAEADVVQVSGNCDLRELARDSRHDLLLTISDRVTCNGRALDELIKLMDDQTVASASCVLLGEVAFKKQVAARPSFGGLFPAGVSFASSPRLSFNEPDVLQALSDMTYPVAANTMHFTVWRRRVLAELPSSLGRPSKDNEDIRLGLDLLHAGYRNICTSRVTTEISGPYTRRDAIDAVGASYAQPGRWEDILSRVTLLREVL